MSLNQSIFFVDESEEVFAEDYDDMTVSSKPVSAVEPEEEAVVDDRLTHEISACPNISNPYHQCVPFCKKRWGNKKFEADDKMIRLRDRMLLKYPLYDGWEEVADPER